MIFPRYRICESPPGNFQVVLEKDRRRSARILKVFDDKYKAKKFMQLHKEGRIR